MSDAFSAAPQPTHRLIPSQFPPIGLFDRVATVADLPAVMELAGWTNDRLVAERLRRLPQSEWVFGRPNSSVIMAAFLHVAPAGMRFNGPDLGAWYGAGDIATAAAEVGHHLRREAAARRVPAMTRVYRAYTAALRGEYLDIRSLRRQLPDVYASGSYAASQAFGENHRASGGAGILYASLRRRGGRCAAAFRPSGIASVIQTGHFEITVAAAARTIDVRRMP